MKFGGFVWVNLDDNPETSLEDWAAEAFGDLRKTLDAEPLQVFHYHKAIVDTNYKLWHDTNCEFYHDFMHYHNRVTGFNDAYFARKNKSFDHGHVMVGTFEVNYDQYEGFESRAEPLVSSFASEPMVHGGLIPRHEFQPSRFSPAL